MRVISGERKGLRLQSPLKTVVARPTEDRVKEALFNVLQPIKEQAVVLDGFACTGQIGIEFLSRGAGKVYFSERNRKNVEMLHANLEKARYEEKAVVLFGDYKRNFANVDEKLDYVFLDPPYDAGYAEDAMERLRTSGMVTSETLVVVESRNKGDHVDYVGYRNVFERDYGTANISIYRITEAE